MPCGFEKNEATERQLLLVISPDFSREWVWVLKAPCLKDPAKFASYFLTVEPKSGVKKRSGVSQGGIVHTTIRRSLEEV